MGHGSHGIMRVIEYLNDLKKGTVVSGAQIKIIQETPSSLIADAQLGVGQSIMPKILKLMQDKLSTQAVVNASVRNCGHIGRIGEWVEKPASVGYPGLLMVNDNGGFFCVAAPGGKQSVTSTNPVAFAVPLPKDEVFLTDMSTSAVAFGKVKLARVNGTQVPEQCIQDAAGKPTTNPEALFTDPPGSILPMGGPQAYKGFALSMFVDMLTAGLSGGQTPPASTGMKYANNFTLTLWNPKFFAGLEHMQKQAEKYIKFIRNSPSADSAKPIRLAGDRMNALKQERESKGIPLSKGLVLNLLNLAKTLNVPLPTELANIQ
jgi:uncharacterized oxidoreductase